MKKIFNCVFAFFNKDLSTLYKEGSAVNFDAVSSNCFRFFTTSFKQVIGDLFGVSVFILLHARSFLHSLRKFCYQESVLLESVIGRCISGSRF